MINCWSIIDISPLLDWTTAQWANIIAAISAAGTVGALAYAFYLERKNSRRIDNLAVISERLTEQNQLMLQQFHLQRQQLKLRVKPDLVLSSPYIANADSSMFVSITNKGEEAVITNILYSEVDFTFQEKREEFPIRLLKNVDIHFTAQPNGGKPVNERKLQIDLHYTDVLGNPYVTVITGHGYSRPTVITQQEGPAS